jgi:hypothetical protein
MTDKIATVVSTIEDGLLAYDAVAASLSEPRTASVEDLAAARAIRFITAAMVEHIGALKDLLTAKTPCGASGDCGSDTPPKADETR